MKNFLKKTLLPITLGIFLFGAVFAGRKTFNWSNYDTIAKRILFTATGTGLSNPVFDTNSGGNIIAYGPLLDGSGNNFITGGALMGYLTGYTETDPIWTSASGNYVNMGMTGNWNSGSSRIEQNSGKSVYLYDNSGVFIPFRADGGAVAGNIHIRSDINTKYYGFSVGGNNKIATDGDQDWKYSFSMGRIMIGNGNSVTNGDYGVAIGKANNITHSDAKAFGMGLISNNIEQILLGKYNVGYSSGVLEFGWGTPSSRNNYLTIFQDGSTRLNAKDKQGHPYITGSQYSLTGTNTKYCIWSGSGIDCNAEGGTGSSSTGNYLSLDGNTSDTPISGNVWIKDSQTINFTGTDDQYIQGGLGLMFYKSSGDLGLSAYNGINEFYQPFMLFDDGNQYEAILGSGGLEYAGDYSGNFSPRSLVDKSYVDSIVSNGIYEMDPIWNNQSGDYMLNYNSVYSAFYTGDNYEYHLDSVNPQFIGQEFSISTTGISEVKILVKNIVLVSTQQASGYLYYKIYNNTGKSIEYCNTSVYFESTGQYKYTDSAAKMYNCNIGSGKYYLEMTRSTGLNTTDLMSFSADPDFLGGGIYPEYTGHYSLVSGNYTNNVVFFYVKTKEPLSFNKGVSGTGMNGYIAVWSGDSILKYTDAVNYSNGGRLQTKWIYSYITGSDPINNQAIGVYSYTNCSYDNCYAFNGLGGGKNDGAASFTKSVGASFADPIPAVYVKKTGNINFDNQIQTGALLTLEDTTAIGISPFTYNMFDVIFSGSSLFTINNNGFVKVKGGISIGTTTESCAGDYVGTIKFSGDNFYGCNIASGWVQLN